MEFATEPEVEPNPDKVHRLVEFKATSIQTGKNASRTLWRLFKNMTQALSSEELMDCTIVSGNMRVTETLIRHLQAM